MLLMFTLPLMFVRKICDWTMAGFYSEVYVTGHENVPQDGPIILVATHVNSLTDAAILSTTFPFRRQMYYWAKSTLKNPFAAAMLRSFGIIPIYRSPDTNVESPSGSSSSESLMPSRAKLFQYTSAVLLRGNVVVIFPEGRTYTEPAISQVKKGAAWAAVEYVKAVATQGTKGEAGKQLMIVPAAIVYTDKSRYQSQVLARYGKPICVNDFITELDLEDFDSVHAAVKGITEEIYQRLREMTINASDWDTYNSANIVTEMAYGEGLSLEGRVKVLQDLVEFLSDGGQETRSMKQSFVRYLGLLHYTGISHADLNHLYPLPGTITSSSGTDIPTVLVAILTVLRQLCEAFLHPSMIAFLPVFVLHLPAYTIGWSAARLLSKPYQEPSKAQYKAIFGGLGMNLSHGMVIWMVFRALMRHGKERITWLFEAFPLFFTSAFMDSRQYHLLCGWIGTIAVIVGTKHILWKWHNGLVRDNMERWSRLSASVKILAGLTSPTSDDLSKERLVIYLRPPPPPADPSIKRRMPAAFVSPVGNPLSISAVRLVRPLFSARMDAVGAVKKLETALKDREMQEGRGILDIDERLNDKTCY